MKFFIIFLFLVSSQFSSSENSTVNKEYEIMDAKFRNIIPNESNETSEINGSCGDKAFFTINIISGNVTIYGSGEINDYFSPVKPPVTEMGQYVKHVFIDNGITSIGNFAFFKCTSLISIIFPDSLQSIRYSSFGYCCNLTSICLPKNVYEIGYSAFTNCESLQSVIVNGDLTRVLNFVFYECNSLSYFLYKGRKFLQDSSNYALSMCPKLESIEVLYYYQGEIFLNKPINRLPLTEPEIVGTCGPNATFKYNTSTCILDIRGYGETINNELLSDIRYLVKFVNIEGNITTIDSSLFSNYKNLTSINIPKTITLINSYAFNQCSNLLSIDLPYGISCISPYVFYNCSSLTSILLPDVVTSIQKGAFEYCKSLVSINIPNSLQNIEENAFNSCSNLSSFTIPYGITSINNFVFGDCHSLLSIDIPETVKSIGASAFARCKSLLSINISSVTFYDENAFVDCYQLTIFNIAHGLEIIPMKFVSGCKNIVSITIPDSVIEIKDNAFENCRSLVSINIPNTIQSIGLMAFTNCSKISSINIPYGITSIYQKTFCNCTSLISIDIPDTVTTIGSNAFSYCYSLFSINMSNSVTSINDEAFLGCNSFTSLILPIKTDWIGVNAFMNCTSLSNLSYYGPKEPTICKYAFSGCNKLQSVDVMEYYDGDSFKRLPVIKHETTEPLEIKGSCGENLFYIINKITKNLTIYGSGVIPNYTPENKSDFTINYPFIRNVYINDNITSIGNYAFYGCKFIVSINISSSFNAIGSSAFENCTSLLAMHISESVTFIGDSAFAYCESLSSISIPSNVEILHNCTFHFCKRLSSVIILGNVTEIQDDAFLSCNALSYVFYNGLTEPSISLNSFGREPYLKSVDVMPYYNGTTFLGVSVRKVESIESTEINGSCGENLFYTMNPITGNLTIYGTGQMYNYTTSDKSPFYIGVRDVYIGFGITSIGEYAFYQCKTLYSIDIPESVTFIGQYAFFQCSNLYSIVLPNVSEIREALFCQCESLSSVIFLTNITSMWYRCFEYCKSIAYIQYKGLKGISYSNVFNSIMLDYVEVMYYYDLSRFCNILTLERIFPDEHEIRGEFGTNMSYLFDFSSCNLSITGSGEMESYSEFNTSFIQFRRITKHINIGENITSIGSNAFYNFDALISVTINGSLSKISFRSFAECPILTFVSIKGSVTTIEYYAFERCTSLYSFKLSNAQFLGDCAFRGCTKLDSFDIPYGVEEIPLGFLDDCRNIRSINIPNTVISIKDMAFSRCMTLTSIIIPNSVTSISGFAFSECKSLTSIDIPEMITKIYYGTFSDCIALESVTINGNISEILENAFYNCISLSSFIYKGYEQPIVDNSAFKKCGNLTRVDVMHYYSGDKFGNLDVKKGEIIIPSDSSEELSSDFSSSIQLSENNENSISEDSETTIENSENSNESSENSISENSETTIENSESINENSENSNESSENSISENSENNDNSEIEFSSSNNLINSIETSEENEETQSSIINDDVITEDPSLNNTIPIECGNDAPVGCLLCNKNNPSQCLSCDSSKFFKESVNSNGNCQCISMYELNKDNKCVPEITKCDRSAIDRGCSLCYLSNKTFCVECDVNKGFKNDPNSDNTCECINQDHSISGSICAEVAVTCAWGNEEPVLGCKSCNKNKPNKCIVCDESKGFIINNDTHTCQCKYDGYEINSQGQCIPPTTSHCNEQEMIGCLKCNDNNDHQCIVCDSSKGFILDSNKCKCAVDGYEINNDGVCIPPSESLCMPNVSISGCLKCSENNNQKCSICDTLLNFNKDPNNDGICTCSNDYVLGVNGECFKYIQEKPVLSFNDYIDKKDMDDDCITIIDSSLTINTDKINKDEYNDYKLYQKEIPPTVTDIKIEQNTFENVQLTTNNRNGQELVVQIEPNQKIQIDTSNSDFPINLPADSKNVNIKVETAASTLEIRSDKENVNLGNVSISQNSFVFNSKTNVFVEFVNLFGDSTITSNNDNNNAKITAKKVNIQKGSESKISNLLISEQLNLAPNSVISINEDVSFSSAEFSIYKTNLQRIDHSYFKFNQKVVQFPKRISINNMNDNSFLENDDDKVIIIHQKSDIFIDEMCKKWAEQVNDPNGYKGSCVINDINNPGHNSVYAMKGTNNKPDDDDNNKPDKKGSGLNGGAIAGIVIGCIAAVIIIAVLIYFLVFKKKKNSNSSIEEDNDHNDNNSAI